jgi:aryl-alcohol dehydrogenase-like predicted oxidoreductase
VRRFRLPGTGVEVSELGLGTADFGAPVSEADAFALMDRYAEAGGNLLDTAAIYAAWTPAGKGSSERLIGRWLRARGGARGMLLATKGAHPELATMSVPRLSRAEVAADLEASLRHLGVEQVDLYFLHRDAPGVPVADILGFMEGFVKEGKIRAYGFSNWSQARAEEARVEAARAGIAGFSAGQTLWSLATCDLSRTDGTLAQMDASYAAWHLRTRTPVLPYSSQANGFFQKVLGRREDTFKPWTAALYADPVNRARAAVVEGITRRTGLSVTQVVLGYLLSQPFPVVPLIGPKSLAQLEDCLTALGVRLEPEDLLRLEQPPRS